MKIIDISRTISPKIAVWPGDQPFEPSWSAQISAGASVNVGAIKMSTHTGTHADAPIHFLAEGADITELALDKYVGRALVVEIADAESIKIEQVRSIDFTAFKRLLFKTRSSQLDDSQWVDDIVHLEPKTAEFLGQRGVVLIGLDGPSMDPVHSKTLEAHKMLAKYGIVNLENLKLDQVKPGPYDLIALPLKLKGLDASPVRAVLIERD